VWLAIAVVPGDGCARSDHVGIGLKLKFLIVTSPCRHCLGAGKRKPAQDDGNEYGSCFHVFPEQLSVMCQARCVFDRHRGGMRGMGDAAGCRAFAAASCRP
jgi:hypothetical protein